VAWEVAAELSPAVVKALVGAATGPGGRVVRRTLKANRNALRYRPRLSASAAEIRKVVIELSNCYPTKGLAFFLEGDLHDAHPDGLVGHDPRHVLDQLLLLPHLHRVRGRQQVRLAPPALQGAGGDVHVLADIEGRPASVLLLEARILASLGLFLVILVLL